MMYPPAPVKSTSHVAPGGFVVSALGSCLNGGGRTATGSVGRSSGRFDQELICEGCLSCKTAISMQSAVRKETEHWASEPTLSHVFALCALQLTALLSHKRWRPTQDKTLLQAIWPSPSSPVMEAKRHRRPHGEGSFGTAASMGRLISRPGALMSCALNPSGGEANPTLRPRPRLQTLAVQRWGRRIQPLLQPGRSAAA